MKWNTEKSSEISSVFQQGAMKSDGRRAILCALCLRVYSHSTLVVTRTAKRHLTHERHIAKAKEFLHGNQKSEFPIDHTHQSRSCGKKGEEAFLLVPTDSESFIRCIADVCYCSWLRKGNKRIWISPSKNLTNIPGIAICSSDFCQP